MTTPDAFWSRVNKREPNECWEWVKARSKKGYGWLRFGPKMQPIGAHRAAWILTHGEIPKGLCVCHTCDNPACCNPSHLFIATNHENVMDSVRKHRHKFPRHNLRGSAIHTSKLSEDDVHKIRAEHGRKTSRELGRKFGVSKTSILAIWRGRNWSHLAVASS